MTPLVLLPGLMCDERLFGPVLNADLARTVNVLSIAGRDSIADIASAIIVEAPESFVLGGLSMGGIVAMEIARQAKERVVGLLLMDTNPLTEKQAIKQKRDQQIAAVKRGELSRVMQEQHIPNYIYDRQKSEHIESLCLAMALALGDEVFIQQSLALRNRLDLTDVLADYDKPALILHGEHDKLCPAERHMFMHNLPQSHYHSIPKAGHLPVLEQPETTLSVIKPWLHSL